MSVPEINVVWNLGSAEECGTRGCVVLLHRTVYVTVRVVARILLLSQALTVSCPYTPTPPHLLLAAYPGLNSIGPWDVLLFGGTPGHDWVQCRFA